MCMYILLNSLIPLANGLEGILISSIRIRLPGNHKNKLAPPTSVHKMMIYHLLNDIRVICGGYGPLRVIPTGNRAFLHILYIRLEAVQLEDLESTGLPTLISDDLFLAATGPGV